jgi:hypothetical protein
LEDLDRLSELDKEFVIEECQTVYEQMLIRWTIMQLNARCDGNSLPILYLLVSVDLIIFSIELEHARETGTSSRNVPGVVGIPMESSGSSTIENVEDQSGKYLIFVVGANVFLISLFYFFSLAPPSPIAGPS